MPVVMIVDLATAGMRLLPPETAHDAGIFAARVAPAWLRPKPAADPAILRTQLAGLELPNPIGLAAGLDKNAVAPDFFFAAGFGFVEIGTVTPQPQPGNPKPRLFRLSEDRALINRFGFNSDGADAVRARLDARYGRPGVLGVNLGANKDATDRQADYLSGLDAFAGRASYFTINISSPNTPGLRGLQDRSSLERLLAGVAETRAALGDRNAPVFLKVAPDLDEEAVADIAKVVNAANAVDGLIVSNTTIARDEALKSRHRGQAGGLSGRPLFERSTRLVSDFRRALAPDTPIIAVGGVEDGAGAYAKIRAGAAAVQVYTALIYHGPGLVRRIKDDLARRLASDGFAGVAEAVGADL